MLERGITYLEQLVIIALVAIVAGFSAVHYSRFILQGSVQSARNQVVAQLRKAQAYAMHGRADSSWGLTYSSGELILFATTSAQFNESVTLSPNINISGLDSLIFNKISGYPSATPTINITSDIAQESVVINSQGMVE